MFRDVPGCSGMFRNVPACSGMFHVPGFIDGRAAQTTIIKKLIGLDFNTFKIGHNQYTRVTLI